MSVTPAIEYAALRAAHAALGELVNCWSGLMSITGDVPCRSKSEEAAIYNMMQVIAKYEEASRE